MLISDGVADTGSMPSATAAPGPIRYESSLSIWWLSGWCHAAVRSHLETAAGIRIPDADLHAAELGNGSDPELLLARLVDRVVRDIHLYKITSPRHCIL
jgi:hypothetical protein